MNTSKTLEFRKLAAAACVAAATFAVCAGGEPQRDWSEMFLYGDWNDSKFKVSDFKSITVEMDKVYGDKLQIKIYGDKIPDTENSYKEQYVPLSATSATTTATFDAGTLGSTFQRITLQTNAGAQTARLKSVKLTKTDGSEVDGTVTAAWGCVVTGETSVSE